MGPNRLCNKGVAAGGNGKGNEISLTCGLHPLGVGEVGGQLRACALDVLRERVRVPGRGDLRLLQPGTRDRVTHLH